MVFNKIDLTASVPAQVENHPGQIPKVWLSAQSGSGIAELKELIGAYFRTAHRMYELHLPAAAGRLRARLFEQGAVRAEQADESGGWILQVNIDPPSLERLCRDEGRDLAMLQ